MGEEKLQQEEYSRMVNTNTILLSFEGWIKYIEGFVRGLQTTKTVNASSVMDCVGEIMEYMRTLKEQLLLILDHCESVLVEYEKLKKENEDLKQQLNIKLLPSKENEDGSEDV